jgi:Ser/Thr protein kinase RdoA (MazF antagonist)
MGVIKRVFFRGNILSRPKHRNLFLDMEENIHIHYRDLRIEMSRAEFEEFSATFLKQQAELQEIIEQKQYQDGKLPNANQEDVRIWTESRLRHDVKYHPQRFSLEECGDGFHFHYRNYKLLFDRDEFVQIARVFAAADADAPYPSGYEDVLALIEDNDVDFSFAAGNVPGETLSIAVARYHLPKIKDIFRYIGFDGASEGGVLQYGNGRLVVRVEVSRRSDALEYRRLRGIGHTGRLVDHLARQGARMDPDELNRVKCQVLDLYYALQTGAGITVETDPQLWLLAGEGGGAVFPYSPAPRGGRADAEALYRAWGGVLAQTQLGFVKPRKTNYAPERQAALAREVDEALLARIASAGAVARIHKMGSVIRGELGAYRAPFVHGKMAKLGSDIDVLVEIDPAREADVPAGWQFVLREASNHCAVYHVGEVGTQYFSGEWQKAHPHIPFVHHLIDAYVHFPSRGFAGEKDAFLRRFGAQLFYDRERDGVVFADADTRGIAQELQSAYALGGLPAVERMAVSTENALYKVFDGPRTLVLKLFMVSGNYSSDRLAEHTRYEADLVGQVRERGVATPAVIPARAGNCVQIGDCPALLFERIEGEIRQKPDYPLAEIGAVLGGLHRVQVDRALDLRQDFSFDDSCMIWLPVFERYRQQTWDDAAVSGALERLAPVAAWHHPGENRGALFSRSPSVHCHGDVTPKNFMLRSDAPWVFDFNNAFYGPRMADVVDGAFEFSLAEKYFHLMDFARFDRFVEACAAAAPLAATEREDLPRWIELVGLIKFAKELRVLQQRPRNETLRRKRALAIADFVLARRVGGG